MKSFFVLCVALVAGIHAANLTLPATQGAIPQKTASECIKETGVSSEALAQPKEKQFAEDVALKKFIFCFFKKADIIDGDGSLNIEVAIAKLPPGVDKDGARKVLEGCQAKTGKTKEDTAYETFKCYDTGVKNYILGI